jgi:hypothetical protein
MICSSIFQTARQAASAFRSSTLSREASSGTASIAASRAVASAWRAAQRADRLHSVAGMDLTIDSAGRYILRVSMAGAEGTRFKVDIGGSAYQPAE